MARAVAATGCGTTTCIARREGANARRNNNINGPIVETRERRDTEESIMGCVRVVDKTKMLMEIVVGL